MTDSLIPQCLTGVWQRLSIETADGQKDTTTQVVYIQTPSCYGDIRIPGQNRSVLWDKALSELSELEIATLARQQGFAGVVSFDDSICRWHRYIDYQPPSTVRDIGSLHRQGNLLIEVGIDLPYREEWQRIDDGISLRT